MKNNYKIIILETETMKRILIIIGQMDVGGAESFIMKMYRAIDRERYQFDFIIAKDGFYSEEIKKLGGKIYYTTVKSKNLFKSMKQITQIVKDNGYENVVRFGTSNAAYFDLLAAKKGGAKNLGVRTLSANQGTFFKRTASLILRPFLNSIATIKFAPSLKAANATYGKNTKKLCILNNGIAYSQFEFNQEKRATIRDELKIKQDAVVFGHVGRLSKEKNHDFLLNVFSRYHSINNNSFLVCVGDGPLMNEMKEKAKNLTIDKNILFLGIRQDISNIYSSFDYFLFPSLFEGMPNSLIEAQANGLTCLYSDLITKECELSKNIYRLELNEELWVDKILSCSQKRTNNYDSFKEHKYLIENTIETFISKLTNTKY